MCDKKDRAEKRILKRRLLTHLPGQPFELKMLVAAFICLMVCSYSLADKIALTNGNILEGVITRQSRSVVVLEHSDLGRMEIPRSRIKSLAIDTPYIEIILKDGDTIQGGLIEENESGVTLQHADLGRIEIPRERIASSKVDVSDAIVELAGGDTIEGKLIERSNYAIVLEHPNLGRIEIPRERIDSLKIKEPEFAKKNEETGWFDPQLRKLSGRTSRLKEKGWTVSIDLSMNTTSGNNEEQSTRFGSHTKRILIDRRSASDLSYYRKVSDNELTDNKLTIGTSRDWLYPGSAWFCYLMGRFDYDEFESWHQRVNGQAGPGYHLFERDDLKLDIRLGLGPRKEWESDNDSWKAEGLIGADFNWDISQKQTCTFSPYFFPVVDDLDDYRARVSGEWRFLFDKDMNLSFLMGTLYEFISIVDLDKDHGDLRTYLGLRYAF